MKKNDLRKNIIPTNLENEEEQILNIFDYIYIPKYKNKIDSEKYNMQRRKGFTDFAQMNNLNVNLLYKTATGQYTARSWLRPNEYEEGVYCIDENGDWLYCNVNEVENGICPCLRYEIQSKDFSKIRFSKNNRRRLDQYIIKNVKDDNGNILYHTIQLGEYPQTKVDEKTSKKLEKLYNSGVENKKFSCTGRWFTGNGNKKKGGEFCGKHSPEFEYYGKKYVRVISFPNSENNIYSDGTKTGKVGKARWVKVEPIHFIIENWNNMPRKINPNGDGSAKYFELRAEKSIISNIPFNPNFDDFNSTLWENSSIREFLNGINVNEFENNQYSLLNEKDYYDECNFINECFNLSREPIKEYSIPKNEKEIADDSFNGCRTLKKIIIHPNVKSIGKNSFNGLNLKYIYQDGNKNWIFSDEKLEKYKIEIELDKIKENFYGFDYNILIQTEDLNDIIKLTQYLNKKNFKLPYKFGMEILKSNECEKFMQNKDFRFFKNELQNLDENIKKCSDDEKLGFFKFANGLGCFSLEKIHNRDGRETNVTFAQKSSSLLARLVKTEELQFRKLRKII